jgi:hypothetical protein
MQRIERDLANDDRSHALGNLAELREIARRLWNNSGRKFWDNRTEGEHFTSRYREVWYFKAKSTRSDIREGFTCSDCSLEVRGARSLAGRSLNDVP